jgi:hypothetical protein
MVMKKTIDFITVDYGLVKNTKILIKSIEKTLDSSKYDFNINLVYQYEGNKEERKNNLLKLFGDKPHITLVEGVDQSDKSLTTKTLDGNVVAWPSSYGIQGYKIGTKACTKEYVCYVDTDTFFTSKLWVDKFIEKLDSNLFVASRYDNSTHFGSKNNLWFKDNKVDPSLGMFWPHLLMVKRNTLIQNNLLPELTFRDSLGNFTLFCYQNNYPYYIFPMIAGSKYRHTCTNHVNTSNIESSLSEKFLQLLNKIGGDFCLTEIKNNSFLLLHYHQSQGWRKEKYRNEYLNECKNFLENN